MRPARLRIAVQREGRLREGSLAALAGWGVVPEPGQGRALVVPCVDADAELLYVRHRDIPKYVELNAADFGIVGEDVLAERKGRARPVKKLGFGRCRLVLAAPVAAGVCKLSDLQGERIASSYPHSLRRFLSAHRVCASIIEISGSVEAAPALGLADAVCDITETGSTLKANGLEVIAEVANWQATLIQSPVANPAKALLLDRIMEEE